MLRAATAIDKTTQHQASPEPHKHPHLARRRQLHRTAVALRVGGVHSGRCLRHRRLGLLQPLQQRAVLAAQPVDLCGEGVGRKGSLIKVAQTPLAFQCNSWRNTSSMLAWMSAMLAPRSQPSASPPAHLGLQLLDAGVQLRNLALRLLLHLHDLGGVVGRGAQ